MLPSCVVFALGAGSRFDMDPWLCHTGEAAAMDPRLAHRAEMAELADAHGSGPCTRKGVEVRVLFSAPIVLETATAFAGVAVFLV